MAWSKLKDLLDDVYHGRHGFRSPWMTAVMSLWQGHPHPRVVWAGVWWVVMMCAGEGEQRREECRSGAGTQKLRIS
jgi:hypothetical protein